MIQYYTGGFNFLRNLGKLRIHQGSLFPKAFCFAIPNAFIASLLVYSVNPDHFEDPPLDHFDPEKENIMIDHAVWGGFSFLIGFLVVFRTSQAYNRFWEGVTQMHKMGAEWFDACSSLVAFCKHSSVEEALILKFQNTLIRLFSMIHAAALGQIEDTEATSVESVLAYDLELIDPESIDHLSMEEVRTCHAKVELIFQWIQQLIVENINTGVLSIPAPVLSRSFQEIANGMVHFHEAMKIAYVPFPFPYAQTCDALLIIHWIMVPFIVSQWVTQFWWAWVFSFIQVFTFWCLNLIALELENPFGTDPNDIDGEQMQNEMNERLRLLLRTATKRTPHCIGRSQRELVLRAIVEDVVDYSTTPGRRSRLSAKTDASFTFVWKQLHARKSTMTVHELKESGYKPEIIETTPMRLGNVQKYGTYQSFGTGSEDRISMASSAYQSHSTSAHQQDLLDNPGRRHKARHSRLASEAENSSHPCSRENTDRLLQSDFEAKQDRRQVHVSTPPQRTHLQHRGYSDTDSRALDVSAQARFDDQNGYSRTPSPSDHKSYQGGFPRNNIPDVLVRGHQGENQDVFLLNTYCTDIANEDVKPYTLEDRLGEILETVSDEVAAGICESDTHVREPSPVRLMQSFVV